MARTKHVDVESALGDDRLRTLLANLDRLPTPNRFETVVTDALWELVTDAPGSDAVSFAELPDRGAGVFGLAETATGEVTLPWWFEEFRWTVREPDIHEVVIDDPDSLREIENLDPTRATVARPELRSDFVDVLEAFGKLRAELARHCDDLDPGEPTVADLPESPFEFRPEGIRTTAAFGEWFEDVIGLCPPVEASLTALLTANANVLWQVADQVLAEDLVERLERLGLREGGSRGDDRVFNWTYYDALVAILRLEGAFDLSLDDDGPLTSPERALYESWAGGADFDPEVNRWVETIAGFGDETLDPVEEREFAPVAFNSPLRLDRTVPVFTPLDEGSYGDRKSAIEDVLRSEGILTDE